MHSNFDTPYSCKLQYIHENFALKTMIVALLHNMHETQYVTSFDVKWLRKHAILITSEKLLIVNQTECQMNENETKRLISVSARAHTHSISCCDVCLCDSRSSRGGGGMERHSGPHSLKLQRKHALFPSLRFWQVFVNRVRAPNERTVTVTCVRASVTLHFHSSLAFDCAIWCAMYRNENCYEIITVLLTKLLI